VHEASVVRATLETVVTAEAVLASAASGDTVRPALAA